MSKQLSPSDYQTELARCREVDSFLMEKYKRWSHEEKQSHLDQMFRWFNKTMEVIPPADRQILKQHWEKQIVILPDGKTGNAPSLLFDHWFTTGSSSYSLPAIAMTDGLGTITADLKLFFAPREVVMSVLAHELAHMLFRAQGRLFGEIVDAPENVAEVYHPSVHHEEIEVRKTLASWGFRQDLLERWEVAVEMGKENWPKLYEKLKAARVDSSLEPGKSDLDRSS